VGVATSVAVVSIPGDALRRVVTALAAGTLIALAGLVWAARRPPPRPDQRLRPDPELEPDPSHPGYLRTEPGMGHRFVAGADDPDPGPNP